MFDRARRWVHIRGRQGVALNERQRGLDGLRALARNELPYEIAAARTCGQVAQAEMNLPEQAYWLAYEMTTAGVPLLIACLTPVPMTAGTGIECAAYRRVWAMAFCRACIEHSKATARAALSEIPDAASSTWAARKNGHPVSVDVWATAVHSNMIEGSLQACDTLSSFLDRLASEVASPSHGDDALAFVPTRLHDLMPPLWNLDAWRT